VLQFTMLLNQKTRQLQNEHEMVKQLAAELDRIKVRGRDGKQQAAGGKQCKIL
jgi:hypothetical protein